MDEVIARNVLDRGRASYAKSAWLEAYEWLVRADQDDLLAPQDLELLARSAYMLGRDDDYLHALERAHHAHLDAGEVPGAARCTWWIGHNLLMRGESARATGWFGRGDRLLDSEGVDCVERGYLLIPVGLQADARGDCCTAYAIWTEAAAVGERYGDPDLVTMARMGQGHTLVRQGRTEEGFRLVDETMVAQEVVKFVARSEIREEVVRLRAHLAHWVDLVDGTEPVGRKLDFLLQEMNREVNTIGSKAEGARASALVVTAKAELEKMREQVQNVE